MSKKRNEVKLNKLIMLITLFVMYSFIICNRGYANSGEMFYFGGITEGSKLPKTIDDIVNTKTKEENVYTYKELVFLDGNINIAECEMTIKSSNTKMSETGSYTVNYVITSNENSNVKLDRNITLLVKYRTVDNQIIKDYTINKWTETIVIGEEKYEIDSAKSTLNLPTIEYIAPAITYFKTIMSNELIYKSENNKVIVTHTGQSFGYNSHWASVETQDIDVKIENFSISEGKESKESNFELIVNLKPSVKMNKTLTYDRNMPYAIAFDGNYIEVMKNSGGLTYEVIKNTENNTIKKSDMKGIISIPSFNTQEILISPKHISMWNGNFAEEDIKKLFSMEILEGDTKYFVPNQALTRSQFIRMIVKALGYKPYEDKSEMAIFEDVPSSHVNYGYVVTAYQKGIIYGTGNGHFDPDATINRQEAFVIYMRALGLSNLASYNTPVTPFIDDKEVDLWAKRDITALYNLGLVKGDSGYVRPKSKLSKAEGAALVNRMIDYLREGIEDEYVKNLINY